MVVIGLIALRDLQHDGRRIPAGAYFEAFPVQAAILKRRGDVRFGVQADATARTKRTYKRRDLTAEATETDG